jgi:hypothetical protein
MRLATKNDKLLTNFTVLVQQGIHERSAFTMKATYQWILHGLLIKVVLFLCTLSVENDLQLQQWLQQN